MGAHPTFFLALALADLRAPGASDLLPQGVGVVSLSVGCWTGSQCCPLNEVHDRCASGITHACMNRLHHHTLPLLVVANVSFHLHAKFLYYLLSYDAVCTVSAFGLVKGYSTLSAENTCLWFLTTSFFRAANDHCLLVSQTCFRWWGSFSAQRCCRWWVSFSNQVLAYVFLQCRMCCNGRVGSRMVTIVRSFVRFWFWRCRFQGCITKARSESLDTAFSVVNASVKEAVVAHLSFFLVLTFHLSS